MMKEDKLREELNALCEEWEVRKKSLSRTRGRTEKEMEKRALMFGISIYYNCIKEVEKVIYQDAP